MDFRDFFIHFIFAHSRLKKYQVSEEKKLSQELQTSGSPKVDRLVPYMCGTNDQLLGEAGNIVFEIIFFLPKKTCPKCLKSAIFTYILQ